MYFDFTAFRAFHIFRKESIWKFEKENISENQWDYI